MALLILRNDTLANWTSSNPILAKGEPAQENDTNRIKIGDGLTSYNTLPYIVSGASSTSGTGFSGTSGWATNAGNAFLLNGQTASQIIATNATIFDNGLTRTNGTAGLGGSLRNSTTILGNSQLLQITDVNLFSATATVGGNTTRLTVGAFSSALQRNFGNGFILSGDEVFVQATTGDIAINANNGYTTEFNFFENSVKLLRSTNTASTSISDVMVLQNRVTGLSSTAGTGYGGALRFELHDDAKTIKNAGAISYSWASALNSAPLSQINFDTNVVNAQERAMTLLASSMSLAPNNSGNYLINAKGSGTQFLVIDAYNHSFFETTTNFGNGVGVLFLKSASTNPSATVTGSGGVIFVDGSDSNKLKYKTASTTYDLTEVGAGGGGSFSGTAGWATNAANAFLLNNQNGSFYQNRSNHTGTQLVYTISDLSTNGTSGYALNTGLLNSQNSAYYLNRTNHTGTQPTSTISDLNAKILTNVFLRC